MPSAASGSSRSGGLMGTVAVKASKVSIRPMVGDTSPMGKDGDLVRVSKPGFIFEFDIPRKDLRFQFMSTFTLFKKTLEWTYSHTWNKETVLYGSFRFNPSNKLSASYSVPTSGGDKPIESCKMKYKYNHSWGTSIEPSYDIFNKKWGCMVSQRINDRIAISSRYESSAKMLDLEWLYESLLNRDGSFKLLASVDVSDGFQWERICKPKIWTENTWNFEL